MAITTGPTETSPTLHRILLAVILISGAAIRFSLLSDYHFGPDELMELSISSANSLGELWRRAIFELHPPLGHYLRFWLLHLSKDPFTIRFFYLGVGFSTLPVLYLIGLELRGRRCALLLTGIASFVPVLVQSSVLIRSYGIFFLISALALYHYLRFTNSRNGSRLLSLVWMNLLLLLSCGFHFTGIINAIAFQLALAWGSSTFPFYGRSRSVRTVNIGTLVLLIAFIAFTYVYFAAPGTHGNSWKQLSVGSLTRACNHHGDVRFLLFTIFSLFALIPGLDTSFEAQLGMEISIAFIFILFLNTVRARSAPLFKVTLLSWVLAFCADFFFIYPLAGARHNIHILVVILPCLAVGLDELISRTPQRAKNILVFPLAVGIVTLAAHCIRSDCIAKQNARDFPLKQSDYGDALQFISREAGHNDIFLGSRFALLYAQFDQDRGKSFYHSANSILRSKIADRIFLTPSRNGYWQLTSENIQDLLRSEEVQTSLRSHGNAWFITVGYGDNLMGVLRQNFDSHNAIKLSFFRNGIRLFSVPTEILNDCFEQRSQWCLGEYRDNLCTIPVAP